MDEKFIEDINSVGATFRQLSTKVKLLGLLEKAKAEYDKNNASNCCEICLEILKVYPDNAAALRGLGCVSQTEGNIDNALMYFKKALENSENKEIEYTLIGTIFYNNNEFDKAIEYYNLAIDCNDNYDLAYEGKNQSILERHLVLADLQDSLIKKGIDNFGIG